MEVISMSSADGRTVKRTRTEINVDEVEETLYLCRNCEQAYEREQIITLAVNIDEDEEWPAERQVCEHCAETVLGYTKAESRNERIAQSLEHWSGEDVRDVAVGLCGGLIALAIPVSILVGILWLISDIVVKLSSPEHQAAIQEASKETAGIIDPIAPLVLLMVLTVIIATMIRVLGGGRRV
jgi:hypothetical protein